MAVEFAERGREARGVSASERARERASEGASVAMGAELEEGVGGWNYG